MSTRPDPTLCPLCGQPNVCAMELERTTGEKQGPCWCTQVDFSAELLERVPLAARGTACICRACASAGSGGTPLAGGGSEGA